MILSCKIENFQGDAVRIYRDHIYRTDLRLSNLKKYSTSKRSNVSKYLSTYLGKAIKSRIIVGIAMYSTNPAVPGPYMFRLISPIY